VERARFHHLHRNVEPIHKENEMKTRNLIITVLLASSLSLFAAAAAKASFSGVWIMDRARSTGLPENMEQKMRVTVEGDKLDLETDLFVGDDVNTVHDNYTLNGKEVDFQVNLPSGQQATGKRTAKWSEDGFGLEVRENATFDTPDGKVTTTMQRKWAMSADGKTLVIELNHTGPNGPISSKRTFTRK
jgi:hypothetical protein